MKDFYLAIENHITTEMPAVKHIDLWNNQLTNMETENPFPTPAVFIEFLPVTWTRLVRAKRGAVTIKLHLVQESYASTQKGSYNQTQALAILDTAEDLDLAVEDFRNLAGSSTEIDNNHDQLIDTIMEYNTTIERSLVRRPRVAVEPDLTITAELKKPAN